MINIGPSTGSIAYFFRLGWVKVRVSTVSRVSRVMVSVRVRFVIIAHRLIAHRVATSKLAAGAAYVL